MTGDRPDDAPTIDRMGDRFVPFGATHGVTVLGVLAIWAALVVVGTRVRGTERERTLRRAVGWSTLLVNVAFSAWLLTPWKFDLQSSLPLHLCDFGWVLATCSMLSGGDPRRLRHLLLHYWGLAPVLVGLATPVIQQGPTSGSFWAFFLIHAQIGAAAVLNLLVFDVRPTLRDAARAFALTAAVGLAITALNVALDVNYWFTGPTAPENPTPIDLLGEWPGRIAWMALLTAAAFVAVTPRWRWE